MTGIRRPTPVVGIGASAGGVEAFHLFFEQLPIDTGLAFVVVLHLPADRKSLLSEILGRWTAMPIVEVFEGCPVNPNTVYVPPPGIVVTLRDGRLHPHPRLADEPRELVPIDLFFNSLATELNEDAVGVVLSGTGHDGALGLKAIRQRGGLTLAQGGTGTAPLHSGMPDSAIAAGGVDIVAPVGAMPGHIVAAHAARLHAHDQADLLQDQTGTARLAICTVLLRETGHEFNGYKEKTFLRRVQRRMFVCALTTLADYVARLEQDRDEALLLFRDLLIGVTGFFRDTATFEALRTQIIPRLFRRKGPTSTVRVWVPGCATGEEAYSLAILLSEHLQSLGSDAPQVQVFATDIDEAAIATARAGRYPSALLQSISAERQARFFVAGSEGSYTVAKDVRALCTFSAHSLTRDPPFSRIDLVSCRNLLIYFDNDLQSIVIPAFHYALVPDGILLLGSSESVSRHEALFAPLDRANRIFQRRRGPSPPLQMAGRSPQREASPGHAASSTSASIGRRDMSRVVNQAAARVLDRYAPAFVVVACDGIIVQYSSRTGQFLEPASGQPTQNVMALARPGLRSPLQTALKQAIDTGRLIVKPDIRMTVAGDVKHRITLTVEPMVEPDGSTLYLVVFQPATEPAAARPEGAADTGAPASADQQLERELSDTQEQLQSITEEHETALEELRSTNEELHSVNEELQSTNEELETSKEEIQSINEELHTANSQLSGNVDELDRKNTDLQNLFESTQVATVFLDPYLVIRGFTPAVADIYNLIPSDLGRPLTDIVSRLRYTGLRDDVHHVLTQLEPLERRVVRDDDHNHYLMRILPYRTPDSTVDGTLVTFVDVTTIVQAEQHQRLLVDELNHRVKNMLTVVISMATQTLRRSGTLAEFSKDFLGRVHALTAAYSLLSSEHWQTVSLHDLVMEEVRPFLDGNQQNVLVEGPRVMLQPRAALALGMAIHELTTNAVKFGALSVPEGKVSLTWLVQDDGATRQLEMRWLERGGPDVRPPAHRGFGMTLIERGLKQDMAAEVTLDFAPDGVAAILRAPLDCETDAGGRLALGP